MNDFLFSTDPHMEQKLRSSLIAIAIDKSCNTSSFAGHWGSLVVAGDAYRGFDPIETERYVIVVLGGPLPRHDDSIADGTLPDDGTRWILKKWKETQDIQWDNDLVGHFAVLCVDKENRTVEVVTDINCFVPVYHTTDKSNASTRMFGSHSDALALTSGRATDIDPVSVGDFLAFDTVTHPYTMYSDIWQIDAAKQSELYVVTTTVHASLLATCRTKR